MKTPNLFNDNKKYNSISDFTIDINIKLTELGYKSYEEQKYKNETFAYWKTFRHKDKKVYQVALLFYDFSSLKNNWIDTISVQYECMLINDDRIDLSVSKNITLAEFEKMANVFYNTMSLFTK